MDKKGYKEPEVEIIVFEEFDIITLALGKETGGNEPA